jgi:hypothetical protein
MLVCSICPKELTVGYACTCCSKLFCADHASDSCLCGNSLQEISIKVETIDDIDIDWIIYNRNKRIGTVGLRFLPSYFFKILSILEASDSQVEVIILPTKNESVILEKALYKKADMTYEDRIVNQKSRYSIFYQDEHHPCYLLLNQQALNEKTGVFLTLLILSMYSKIRENQQILDRKQDEIINSIGQVLFGYNQKMGIPFISADDVIRTLITNLIKNIQQDFFEAKSIHDLLAQQIYDNDIGDYLKYKIEITFQSMDYSARFIIFEVFQNLEKILHLIILTGSASPNAKLFNFLMNSFNLEYLLFKQKYSDMLDLIRAADLIVKNQQRIIFNNFDEFVKSVSLVIMDAFSQIEARYVSLGESLDLVRLSNYYLDELENHKLVFVPKIGTIYGYTDLLQTILQKEGVYPEVRIMAGYALENTLLTWLMLDSTPERFQQYAKNTKILALLIEKSIPEIMEKNGSTEDFQGSSLKYDDAAQKLLTASKVAKSFGDIAIETEFAMLAESIAIKYNLPSIKTAILWTKFVDTQNFDYLDEIRRVLEGQDEQALEKINFLASPIRLLAESLLTHDGIDQKIDKAQQILFDSVSVGVDLKTDAIPSLRTSEGLHYVLEIFRNLLKFENGNIYSIRQAYNSALALKDVLLPKDPLLILTLKTAILFYLVKGNMEKSATLCEKLSLINDVEGFNRKYVEMAYEWISISRKDERGYIYKNRFEYKGKDVWLQALSRFIEQSMERELSLSLAGSKAIVLVEGITDSLVFQEFKEKIAPFEKIRFIDLEGFPNFSYYTESRVIKELKVPTYLIFDGDTREEERRKIIENMKKNNFNPSHSYTLIGSSIEYYLLDSRAITSAFCEKIKGSQEVELFLRKMASKKNKKAVAEILCRHFGLGQYDKNLAKKIAASFKKDEISPEISSILLKIVQLQNIDD